MTGEAHSAAGMPSPPRRPGTPARLFLLVLSLAGFLAVLALAFPPGATDRLPALVLALALALLTSARRERGLLAFCFLFPCAGLLARLFSGTDPMAWPLLLFAAVAVGWTFRFVYDFEGPPSPSRLDPDLRALLAIWALSALVAVARARTLWAFLHGLSGRAVNADRLPDAVAVRESVLAFCTLAGGAALFFLLRRSRDSVRRLAILAGILGVSVSALAAVLQRSGLLAGETRPFWKLTGRLSGGAADPNSLGLLCGLALLVTAAALARPTLLRAAGIVGALLLAAGLLLSGSRSGFLIPLFGLAALLLFRRLSALAKVAMTGAAAALLATAVFGPVWGAPGSLKSRLGETFDSALPIEYRISARPVLWKSALVLFSDHPVAGAGLGAFSWRLPDLLRQQGQMLPMRDNPGNTYLQALAESGILGLAVTLAFAFSLGRQAARAIADRSSQPERVGAGLAVLAFLLALMIGAHWMASDVCFFFFLLAATVVTPVEPAETPAPARRRLRAAAVLLYAVAAAGAVATTSRAEEAFRHSAFIGFHEAERGPGGLFRWTHRRFAVLLPPGEAMRWTLAHYTPEGREVTLESRWRGRVVLRRRLRPGESLTLNLRAPRSERLPILFSLSRSVVPKRLGVSEDRRELGLMILNP